MERPATDALFDMSSGFCIIPQILFLRNVLRVWPIDDYIYVFLFIGFHQT